MTIKLKDRRWKCPLCGSKKIQVGLPAWHYESKNHSLEYIETDVEADIMWWFCESCGESAGGCPEENE
jgi:rubrerythrin